MLLIPEQSNEDKGELVIDLCFVYISYQPSKQETDDNDNKEKNRD